MMNQPMKINLTSAAYAASGNGLRRSTRRNTKISGEAAARADSRDSFARASRDCTERSGEEHGATADVFVPVFN